MNSRGICLLIDEDLDIMAAGANAYLPKPFQPAQLRALVQKLCPPSPVTTAAPGAERFRATTDA